ncbi:MAG: hypothetical protein ACI87W_002201 [Halieaceae bacterium]|jgi:uncharacterized protein YqgV (UPF0045/DUF77 family)
MAEIHSYRPSLKEPDSMTLCAELSLYPLCADYVPPIQAFIDDLKAYAGITIVSNAMSTQLRGEHDAVMAAVSGALRASTERYAAQVLVCKFIPLPLDIDPLAQRDD